MNEMQPVFQQMVLQCQYFERMTPCVRKTVRANRYNKVLTYLVLAVVILGYKESNWKVDIAYTL